MRSKARSSLHIITMSVIDPRFKFPVVDSEGAFVGGDGESPKIEPVLESIDISLHLDDETSDVVNVIIVDINRGECGR